MTITPHIIIATTFRDFNGSKNDEIQKRFLESLRNQTYKEFTLVVTVFNEKNVENVVSEIIANSTFFHGTIPIGKKFCLSDVLINGLNVANQAGASAVLWTTCDVIYPIDFLEIISGKINGKIVLTSHPHHTKKDGLPLEPRIVSIESGFDLMIMGQDVIRNKKFRDSLKSYYFYDWGLFEHFLIALAAEIEAHTINLYKITAVVKIENDRAPGRETIHWLENCWLNNKIVMDKFLADHSLSRNYFSLAFCHFRFATPFITFRDRWAWRVDYLKFLVFLARVGLVRIVPSRVKSIIRGLK